MLGIKQPTRKVSWKIPKVSCGCQNSNPQLRKLHPMSDELTGINVFSDNPTTSGTGRGAETQTRS